MKKPLHLEDLAAALEAKPPAAEQSEAHYKRQLVEEVNDLPGGYAQRIEDKFLVGALDMFLKLPDPLPGVWAEAKLVEGNVFAPTRLQFNKGERMIQAGLVVVLIGWQRGTMYVSPWVKQADKRQSFTCDRPHHEVLRECLLHWERTLLR